MTEARPDREAPEDWDDAHYLRMNPDVRAAVGRGAFPTGYAHYMEFGIGENRESGFTIAADAEGEYTRNCLDPWVNLEIAASGEVRPCCISPPLRNQRINTIDRDAGEFRDLRAELLAGKLRPMCANCHIRSKVPVARFQRFVDFRAAQNHVEPLASVPLESLRVDINEQCNLRCTYCAVSQPGYAGKNMAPEVFDATVKLIAGNPAVRVDLNGHGETSFHPRWLEYAAQIHALRVHSTILSNFAKIFTPEEAEAFARMQTIQISIDSTDEEMLKAIRRKVSFTTIRLNVANIRAKAQALGLKPTWSISCGVYDQNIHELDKLASFAIEEKFNSVTFWNLVEYPPLEGVVSPKPIATLPPAEHEAAVREVTTVVHRLREAGVFVEIPDSLVSA
ncbi:MAG TPA: radical SAM protein [Ramlibacter sp.]|nr:radical SAM protein [Ramlibacter sp.]